VTWLAFIQAIGALYIVVLGFTAYAQMPYAGCDVSSNWALPGYGDVNAIWQPPS